MKLHTMSCLVALGLLACSGGSSGDKPSCGAPGSCKAGSFCAQTPDGNVCWPDSTAPAIGLVSLQCSTNPCRRDSVLTVTAQVVDESYGNAMGEVRVALDLDPEHPRALPRVTSVANDYRLEIPLEDLPFPHFTAPVAGTVVATDEAGNATEPKQLVAVNVTRAKWTVALPGTSGTFPLSMPAVAENGRLALVGADGSLHLLEKDGGGVQTVALGGAINGPPVIGAGAIWLAGQDGQLHKRALANGTAVPLTDCATTGGSALLGPPAVLGDRVVASSNGMEVLVAKASNACVPSNLSAAVSSPPAIDASGHVTLAAATVLRQFTVALNSGLLDSWAGTAPPVVGAVAEPPAIDAEQAVWTTALSGVVVRASTVGVAGQVSAMPSASTAGPIILPDNSAVIADYAGTVRRLTAAGTTPWTTNPTISGHPRIPLATGGSEPGLLVPTSDGWLYVLRQSTGAIVWSAKLSAQSLQPANIWTEPDAKTSTAYLAGADGTLYAVIVDGALDTTAPWPKAYHDPQNTSNAGTPF